MMIIKALMIDDDMEWVQDIKTRIEQQDEVYFSNFDSNLKGIKINVVDNTTDAIKSLMKNETDIFLIDIELSDDELGHEFYEKLFTKDIQIPGIAVSAVVNTPEFEKEIKRTGISKIVPKMRGSDSVEDRIVSAIVEVVQGKKLDQIMTAVDHLGIGNMFIKTSHGYQPVDTCMQWLRDGKFTKKEDVDIYSRIRMKCLDQDKLI